MEAETVKLKVSLILAKLEITKLKFIDQGYEWSLLGKDGQKQIEECEIEINEILKSLTLKEK